MNRYDERHRIIVYEGGAIVTYDTPLSGSDRPQRTDEMVLCLLDDERNKLKAENQELKKALGLEEEWSHNDGGVISSFSDVLEKRNEEIKGLVKIVDTIKNGDAYECMAMVDSLREQAATK